VNDAWLALTSEPALEPELPLCDPHHHLWEFPGSRYLAGEMLAELGGHRLTHTVFVECMQHYRVDGPEALRPVGETEFVDRLARAADRSGSAPQLAAGIVAFADLTLGVAVEDVLRAHLAASGRVRSVRYATAWDASRDVRPAHTRPAVGLMGTPHFRAGIATLARLGLHFDAWLYHTQFAELVELADDFPELRIVLDHMGGPLGIGPYAGRREQVFSDWRNNLAAVARCPNVSIKLGGLTMTSAGFGWHKRPAPPGSDELASAMRPYFDTCIQLFGPKRCMLESNFPMDRASCAYGILWNAFKRVTAHYALGERARLLRETAMDFYRLDDAAGP
jgi:predicted TIM-barrel fold metal-dependent hydrolase